ncbi:MAG TPA: 3-oxoacyl-ACP reductase [Lachnospiraceae bacterium]|nr:3-oxoacyl-ACP reductase [Lachnospiraceae bacterium]
MRKNIIITGASRGIGAETARLFAQNGCNVIINYNKSEAEAIKLREEIIQKGGVAEIFKADVLKREEVDSMIEFCISQFGGIDILVNNAGIAKYGLFMDITEKDWDETININLKGVFNCSQSVIGHMINRKEGKIINIASIWGMVGSSCEVAYSVSKAGVIGLTKALAKELGPSNIQVNCVAPGAINTDMNVNFSKEEMKDFIDATPLMRLGKPIEIAEVVLFLAEKADFITGQIISPNGGYVI